MPTYTEESRLGDLVKHEYESPWYCRDVVTLVSGQNLKQGAVVGQITASGKYQALATSGTTGAQNAAGVLVFAADASGGDRDAVVFRRGPLRLSKSQLVWPAGIGEPAKAAAIAQLLALGIRVSDSA